MHSFTSITIKKEATTYLVMTPNFGNFPILFLPFVFFKYYFILAFVFFK